MRAWVQETLKLAISELVDDRIYQSSALEQVPTKKPYVIHRFGSTVPALSMEEDAARSTPLTLYFHDVPGSYERMDELLQLVKKKMTQVPPALAEPRLIRCLWTSHSADLPQDPKTGTIIKLSHYRLVHKA